MEGKKRNLSAVDDGTKQTKKHRQAAPTIRKKEYFTPKASPSIKHADDPLENLMPQQRIDLIADLCESVLEDPTEALVSSRTPVELLNSTDANTQNVYPAIGQQEQKTLYRKSQSKLDKLLDLACLSTNGYDAHAARLAILSLLAIFQDILPSYRIRLPTDTELSIRVSKETKKMWDHERKLLTSYQKYLQLLQKTWESGKFGSHGLSHDLHDSSKKVIGLKQESRSPSTLAATAIISLSELLTTCYNFNFRSIILRMVVIQSNNLYSDEVRRSCCNALSNLFVKDTLGEASLEAVRYMAKMIKERFHLSMRGGKGVHPDLLSTWISLPLRIHHDEAVAAKIQMKAKKRKKDTLEIERALKDGDAIVDKVDLARNQGDILHCVTLSYFHVLKKCSKFDDFKLSMYNKKRLLAFKLIPICLEGLAKISHLIHIDAISDLMSVLKEMVSNSQMLQFDAEIHCILCALKTLGGPGRNVIPVDCKEFLIPLYNALPKLCSFSFELDAVFDSNTVMESIGLMRSKMYLAKTLEATIQCLDHAFIKRRELSTARVAAFLKRLLSTSLHCPPHVSTTLLSLARQLFFHYSSSCNLEHVLENEEEIAAKGIFIPDAEDPEHSNSHATSLWELALLHFHVHPDTAGHSTGMASQRLLRLPEEGPAKVGTIMGKNAQEGFISYKMILKSHPLKTVKSNKNFGHSVSKTEKSMQSNKYSSIRFITPRKTAHWHLLPVHKY